MKISPNQLLGGITPETFLTEYWQKKPLLIRNAIPDFTSPINGDELAGLACEDGVESRLILERDGPHPWTLEHGPFAEQRFAALPETHWTLLVQECNKYVPELAALMAGFNFIPYWRVDDVMVSYAPNQGTVGPHADQYDVFLLQGPGKRRWQISTRPVDENNRIADLDLSILQEFEPTEEWTLASGDMLYLPPGIAHHGVALEDCITFSIGFRAPTHADMMTSFIDSVASKLKDGQRYADPDLSLQQHPGEISRESLRKVREILRVLVSDLVSDDVVSDDVVSDDVVSDDVVSDDVVSDDVVSDDVVSGNVAIDSWFGRFVTESTSGEPITEPEQRLKPEQFLKTFRENGQLERSEYARFAFINQGDKNILFIDGEEYPLVNELAPVAPLLCNQRQYSYANLAENLKQASFTSLLTDLYNTGYVTFSECQGHSGR